jgi:CubicO group peptidase (beta-lactamase class C family)
VLVLDEYFRGFGPDDLHDLRSASKAFTSILFGVAMASRPSLSDSTRVADALPGNAIDRRMTVGHLLSHTSGLACDDNDDDSPGLEDRMQAESTDWYGHTLALSQLHAPGDHYAYCSGGINLVGAIIAKSTGMWLPAFFDRALARPLGITEWAMNLMPSGEGYSGGGVHLRPRDLLKVGELYRGGGVWKGRQVVSREWVGRSTSHHVDLPDGSADGLGWHRHLLRVGDRSYQTYEASGNGGQFLIVVPELELTIAVTAGNYGQYLIWRKIRQELVPRWILGAVTP